VLFVLKSVMLHFINLVGLYNLMTLYIHHFLMQSVKYIESRLSTDSYLPALNVVYNLITFYMNCVSLINVSYSVIREGNICC